MVQTCHKVEKSYNLLVNFQLVADSICRTAFSVVANGVRGTKSKSLFPVTYQGQSFAKFVAFGRPFIYFLCRQKVSKKLVAQRVIKGRLKRVFLQLARLAQTSKNTFPFKPPFKGNAKGRQVLFACCIVVVVILESCSPGSVVTQKEENNRYWNAPRRQTFQYDLYFYKQPLPNR
ncbi:hypothetical protein [Candidatus Avelusimicrobium sp.]|uniref:hypothetical protein n=1 Tax=Candidatus Avelusimicrobium sp. TaxID=3048833 RepID=UPI003D7D6A76